MDYQSILQSVGLSESESRLYLESLKLGPATAIQLSKRIGMSRQIIYVLTESLLVQGLMKQVSAGTRRLFQAVGPDALMDRVTSIQDNLERALPLLKTQEAAQSSLPILSVYENPISMREWYRRFMRDAKNGEELLIWATNKTWYEVDPDYLKQFVTFKKKHRIRDRIIAPDSLASRRFAHDLRQPHAEYRFLKDWWQTDAEKWVWRDTVSFLTIQENATNLIVIESAPLAAIERFNFQAAWEKASL